MHVLRRLADSRRPGALASRFRRRRFALFESLIAGLEPPIRILDVGGTPSFWENRGFVSRPNVSIVLVNLFAQETGHPSLRAFVGDAADLTGFPDRSFDVAFSNSVIEHLETFERQLRMASEIRRVAERYFVQTPNQRFPLEPHFLIPGFQFLPIRVRAALLRRFDLGHRPRQPDQAAAEATVREIRLMTGRELREAFPGGTLWRERFLGLTKSFVIHGGWDRAPGPGGRAG
jgi:SAM-dependent methyltransferase